MSMVYVIVSPRCADAATGVTEREKDGGMLFVVVVAIDGTVTEVTGSGVVVTVMPGVDRVVRIDPGPIGVAIVVPAPAVGVPDSEGVGVPVAPPGGTGFSVKLVKARAAIRTSKITTTTAM